MSGNSSCFNQKMALFKAEMNRVWYFLLSGKYPQQLMKNETRILRRQKRNHVIIGKCIRGTPGDEEPCVFMSPPFGCKQKVDPNSQGDSGCCYTSLLFLVFFSSTLLQNLLDTAGSLARYVQNPVQLLWVYTLRYRHPHKARCSIKVFHSAELLSCNL